MTALLTEAFLRHRKALIGQLTRIVRDPHIAEELAQETYIRARQAADAGPIEHVDAFLYRTARNLGLDYARRQKMKSKVERFDAGEDELANIRTDVPSAETTIIDQERLRRLQQALAELSPRAQQVWRLSRLEGWTYARIAEHLGVSPNTVFNDVKLAVAHCHDALARFDRN